MVGVGDWAVTDRDGQVRWARPLVETASGELTGLNLVVDGYPRELELKFVLVLTYGSTICRVDYGPDVSHLNKGNHALGIPPELIVGPHAHVWGIIAYSLQCALCLRS